MINIMIDIDKIRNTNVFQNLYIQSYFCFVLIFMNRLFINASPPSLSFFSDSMWEFSNRHTWLKTTLLLL